MKAWLPVTLSLMSSHELERTASLVSPFSSTSQASVAAGYCSTKVALVFSAALTDATACEAVDDV